MTRSSAIRAITLGALIVAIAYFLWRGVWRGLLESSDLSYGFAAVQAWLDGQNPYDAGVLAAIVVHKGGVIDWSAIGHGVYFPTSIPLFVPIAFASWQQAKLAWLVLDVVATLFIALGLTRWLGWRLTSTKALAMTAFILALGPVHTTVAAGQTGVVATAFIVGAMLLERAQHGGRAGVAYALAAAAKLQIGLPFVAYVIWRRRWRTVATATAALGALTLVSIARMELAATPWLGSLLTNLDWLTGPQGNGDPGPENPGRFSLINLAYPLRTFLSEGQASMASVLFVAAAAAAMLWLIRGRWPREELLALSIVAVLTLLVSYHRYYDAALLALPIAWAFSTLGTPLGRYGVGILALGGIFILPSSQVALSQAGAHLPAWLTGTPLWATFIQPHQVWALVLMVAILLVAAARVRSSPGIDG